MEDKFAELEDRLAEITDLSQVSALLGWDQQTYMPPAGVEGRGNHMATIDRILHLKRTSDELGQLLADLAPLVNEWPPDSVKTRLVKVTKREFEKRTKVPVEWVEEFARLTTLAEQAWEKARAEDKFANFQPYLERIVDMKRSYAGFFAPYEHVYDPLLDDFEPGTKTMEVKAIFEALRPQQVALIREILACPPIDDSFLHQHFDEQKQWDFGVQVITKFGFPWDRGRQDKSPHPFTSSFGVNDVRITTPLYPDHLESTLFGTMHEAGHGLYDLGIHPAFARSPLGDASSAAVHESQSRMWENLVGRSRPFWKHFYPKLQETFPAQLGNVSLESFYKAVNKVQPSLIRVEADEATYNLHIMLRLGLEISLLEGSLLVSDLPEAWNSGMEEYLGIRPHNDTLGVLQDIHWSVGLMGYFSTYALGNLISLQLWERIRQDIPDLDEQIEAGEFRPLLEWLHENIHQHGSMFEPQELIARVTGSRINPDPYVRYLTEKYREIYGI